MFGDLSQMTAICDINGPDLKTNLKLGTEISLKCSNDHALQFEWSRNGKLMSFISYKKTSTIMDFMMDFLIFLVGSVLCVFVLTNFIQ